MTESTMPLETSEQSTQPAGPAAEISPREKLAAYLNGESQDEGEAGESQENAEPQAGEPKGKPKALKDLAERLNVSDADLYAIEVPMSDGKSLSIGKLKDAAAKQDDLTVRELELEERVNKREAEWTRANQELQELLSQLDPKAIKPEVRERVRAKVENDMKREREMTLKAIPEWANAQVREAELVGMTELLKDYGISEQFLTATMNHKVFRFVRDAYLRKARVEKALANVVAVKKPSTTGKAGAGNGAPRKPQNVSQTRGRETARDRLNKQLLA